MLIENDTPFIIIINSTEDFLRSKNVLKTFGFKIHKFMENADDMEDKVAIMCHDYDIPIGRIRKTALDAQKQNPRETKIYNSLDEFINQRISNYFEDQS